MKLSKPIKKGDEEIFDITLREPTGQDLIEIGYPYVIVMDEADGQSLRLLCPLSERERSILLAGGLLNLAASEKR